MVFSIIHTVQVHQGDPVEKQSRLDGQIMAVSKQMAHVEADGEIEVRSDR